MKYKILLVIFSICLVLSAVLSSVSISTICGVEKTSGCNMVNSSKYSQTFGISNSMIGVMAFTLLILLTIWNIRSPNNNIKKLLFIIILIAGLFSIYLLYLQFFVIGSICKYCLVVDILNLVSLVIMIFYKE